MKNLTVLTILILVLLLVSCSGSTPPQDNGDNIPDQGAVAGQGNVEGTDQGIPDQSGAALTSDPGVDQSHDAQELLRNGDFEAAIAILEDMSANEENIENLTGMLIEAHLGYAQAIALSRRVDPRPLNEVLYSHYMRILELDPENEEAQAGINAASVWFEGHGMELPSEIDPLAFLPVGEDQSSENSGFIAGEEEPPVSGD